MKTQKKYMRKKRVAQKKYSVRQIKSKSLRRKSRKNNVRKKNTRKTKRKTRRKRGAGEVPGFGWVSGYESPHSILALNNPAAVKEWSRIRKEAEATHKAKAKEAADAAARGSNAPRKKNDAGQAGKRGVSGYESPHSILALNNPAAVKKWKEAREKMMAAAKAAAATP